MFEGIFVDDQRSSGVFRSAKGDVCGGDWLDGKLTGQGQYKYANGDTFEGLFEGGKKVNGVYTYENNSSYTGAFVDDVPHSDTGIFRLADGSTFHGSFSQGQQTGRGIFRFISGDVYEGDVVDGLKQVREGRG